MQKIAVNIILSNHDTTRNSRSYKASLALLGIDTLENRRVKLCETFAKKCLRSRHSDLFTRNSSTYNTRNKNLFAEYNMKTNRAFMSPLVYLTRILNKSSE